MDPNNFQPQGGAPVPPQPQPPYQTGESLPPISTGGQNTPYSPPAYVPQQPYQPPATPYQSPVQPTIQEQFNASNGQFGQPVVPPQRDTSLQPATPTPPPRPRNYGKAPLPIRIVDWLKGYWWAPLVTILGIVLLGDILYQFAYPMAALPQGMRVDGVVVGGLSKDEAAKKLDDIYGKVKVDIYFGKATVPYKTPTASEVGIQVHNISRLKDASYPLWLRFVPTSMWWAKDLVTTGSPVFDYDSSIIDTYTRKNVGVDCYIMPQNASLKLDDGHFSVVSAQPGGKCDINKFKDGIKEAKIEQGKITIRTDIEAVDAPVNDAIARQLGDELNHNLDGDKKIQAGGQTDTLASNTIKGWLSFKAVVPDPNDPKSSTIPPRLAYVIEPDRVRKYFDGSISQRTEKQPGVTKISTTDFNETSHVNGTPGTLVDMDTTIKSIDSVVTGRKSVVVVTTKDVPPTVKYTRSYTPTAAGYMALVRQFGEDNGGRFGIKFVEIQGRDPLLEGSYRADQPFPAAGVEGAYIAYAAQAGIEDGTIQPTDRINGNQDVDACIEQAVSVQDKDCINALLNKVSNTVVVQRLRALGMTQTDLSGATITTTANDFYTFMKALKDRKSLAIKKTNAITSPLNDITMRDGFLKANTGSGAMTIGGSNDGYNEAIITNERGTFIVAMLSDQKDSAAAQNLLEAIQKIRDDKYQASLKKH